MKDEHLLLSFKQKEKAGRGWKNANSHQKKAFLRTELIFLITMLMFHILLFSIYLKYT